MSKVLEKGQVKEAHVLPPVVQIYPGSGLFDIVMRLANLSTADDEVGYGTASEAENVLLDVCVLREHFSDIGFGDGVEVGIAAAKAGHVFFINEGDVGYWLPGRSEDAVIKKIYNKMSSKVVAALKQPGKSWSAGQSWEMYAKSGDDEDEGF